jgi:selenocysteine lyase/cysteine desulfurase
MFRQKPQVESGIPEGWKRAFRSNASLPAFPARRFPAALPIHDRLIRAKIVTDVRGERIRFGFGCYHAVEEIDAAVAAIARAIE